MPALPPLFLEQTRKPLEVFFAGYELPEMVGETHLMIVGTTGSGKTLTFKLMMSSLLKGMFSIQSSNLNRRAVIFDEKQDIYSFLRNLNISDDSIYLLNPFDRRCFAWNMAEDITGPDTALQVATIFIPEEHASNNRYFSDAARAILTGVIRTFIKKSAEQKKKNSWYLSDILAVMRNPDLVKHVLSQTPEGEDLINLHLREGKTANDILSTAGAFLAPFEVVGALWKQAQIQGRHISLRKFLMEKSILVLGNYQEARAPIEAINRLIFQRLTQLVLALPENEKEEKDKRRIWFFLDELRKLGKLPGLDDLMNNGRSKGACVVIGFQDIQGLRAVYEEKIADEITSMCSSIMVLRLSGTATPKWAADIFGEIRDYEFTETSGIGTDGQGSINLSRTKNQNSFQRTIYYDSDFKNLPIIREPDFGLTAFCFSPYILQKNEEGTKYIAPFKIHFEWEKIKIALNKINHVNEKDFSPWVNQSNEIDEGIKYLKPLNNSDWNRLGIKPFVGESDKPENAVKSKTKFRFPTSSSYEEAIKEYMK